MSAEAATNFESIESAHEFLQLLAEVITEAKQEIDADIDREAKSHPAGSRRLDAMRTASYSLQKLELHLKTSGRILNDLRSLRRLLFQERTVEEPAVAAKPMETPIKPPAVTFSAAVSSRPRRSSVRARLPLGA